MSVPGVLIVGFIVVFVFARLIGVSPDDSAGYGVAGAVIIFVLEVILRIIYESVMYRKRQRKLKKLLRED